MIAILDGMSGSGKTTTIATLLARFKGIGVRACSIKPVHNPAASVFSAPYDWARVIHDQERVNPSTVVLIDRGLGTEFLFSPLRGYDRTYQASILTLHKMTSAYLESIGHHFAEYVLVTDRQTQIDRGRISYIAQPSDTRQEWEKWASLTRAVIVPTANRSQVDVVSFIFDSLLWQLTDRITA